MKDIGLTLKALRLRANLSQARVGAQMGYKSNCGRSKVCQLEKNSLDPRMSTVERFLDAVGATWLDLATLLEE